MACVGLVKEVRLQRNIQGIDHYFHGTIFQCKKRSLGLIEVKCFQIAHVRFFWGNVILKGYSVTLRFHILKARNWNWRDWDEGTWPKLRRDIVYTLKVSNTICWEKIYVRKLLGRNLFYGKRLLEKGPCTFKVNIWMLECIPKRIHEIRVGSFQPREDSR